MNPRPTEASIPLCYPEAYFSHQEINKEAKPHLKHRIRDWVLETYYGYPDSAGKASRSFVNRVIGLPLWMIFRAERRNSLIIPFIGKGRFLDAGCGSGKMLRFMKARGWDVAGIEMDPELAERLRREQGLKVSSGNIEDCSFPDESFDVALMSHVVEHLRDPNAVLRKVGRMLAPDGRLYLLLPRRDSFAARTFKNRWFGLDAPRHLSTFSRDTIRRLLERNDFEVCSLKQDRNSPGLKNTFLFLEQDGARVLPLIAKIKPLMRLFGFIVHLMGQGDGMVICARKKRPEIAIR